MKWDDYHLPESLENQIDAVERRLLVTETVVAVCGGLFGFLLAYAVIFGLDRLHDTPAALRWLLTLGATALFVLFAFLWMRLWVLRRRDARDMAKLVGRRHPSLGDRLLGVVELAEGDGDQGGASPQLVQAAINQVAHESEDMDFEEAVSKGKPIGWGLAFGGALALVLGLFIGWPSAAGNALSRMFGDAERFTFASIHEIPDRLVFPHGEPTLLKVGLKDTSEWVPGSATAVVEGQPPIEAEVENRKAGFLIPEQIQDCPVTVRIGDDSKQALITPRHRPTLGRLEAEIVYPEYLERPPETFNVLAKGGQLDVLEGSRFVVGGGLKPDTVRDPDQGRIEVPRVLGSARIAVSTNKDEAADWRRLKLAGGGFESPEFAADDMHEAKVSFSWVDKHEVPGFKPQFLDAAAPYTVRVRKVRDKAPLVKIDGLQRTVVMLEEEILEIRADAADDFGLQRLDIVWEDLDDPEETGAEPNIGGVILDQGDPTRTRLAGDTLFSPQAEEIPVGSTLRLWAEAADYYPGRAAAKSLEYHIYVLSKADHAAILRARMEDIQAALEDVARDEEENIEQNKEMLRNPHEMKPAKLAQQESAERAQKARMEELSRKAEELVEEARKNDQIGSDTKQEWSELSKKMKDVADQELSEASKSLNKASNSDDPGEQKENLDEAVKNQEKALAKMREMEKEANKSIENMIAQNFINRLKERAKEEKSLGQQLQVLGPQAFGARKQDLPEELADQFEYMGTRQLHTRKEAGYIQDDLLGFFNRTKKQPYKDIYDEMTELSMRDQLEELADSIRENHTGEALGLTGNRNNVHWWEEKFNEWAGVVEQEKNENSDQEQEQQDMDQELLDVLYALLRARGAEERIREKTRKLEEVIQAEYGEPSETNEGALGPASEED